VRGDDTLINVTTEDHVVVYDNNRLSDGFLFANSKTPEGFKANNFTIGNHPAP